ncbi:hypothetical protein ABC382_22770 [Lysinibacillus sp. 1P01SD]|uniref:hypothetical protein n=1 Tax=Lysinibacillus TaxID=400634 RepID=UPI002AD21D23|nr:hypothetical protein [Lysinibacillus irui]MEA0565568.1 hypothetical protein [Lysinibacillus irui]
MSTPKVVMILDKDLRLVMNKGSDDDVKLGDVYLVFELGDTLYDPDTFENLGQLELVKGRGKVIHVQEKVATLETIETEKITHRSSPNSFSRVLNPLAASGSSTEEIPKPFLYPKVGDLLKKISK